VGLMFCLRSLLLAWVENGVMCGVLWLALYFCFLWVSAVSGC